MQAKRGCGTVRATVLPMWRNLVPKCGTLRELKSWGLQVGTAEFEHAVCAARLAEEDNFGRPSSGSLICSALGRSLSNAQVLDAITFLRTMPPSRAAEYAEGHDVGMQQAMKSLLEGMSGDARQQGVATQASGSDRRHVWHRRLFLASWADALPMLQDRLPSMFKPNRRRSWWGTGAWLLGRASNSQRFRQPSRVGAHCRGEHLLPTNTGPSPGEWLHGWQYFASSASEHRLYLSNHVPPTRPISVLIRERDRGTFCVVRFSPRCSGQPCARGCVCHSN